MESAVYKIINLQNNKIYIGSSLNVNQRLNAHKRNLRDNKHINKILQEEYNSFGVQNFVYGIIEYVEYDKELLLDREQYWLDYYKSYDNNYGYNIFSDSRNANGYKHTDESKKKMSEFQKGKVLSDEHKNKISETLLKNPPTKGKIMSDETKQKLSISHTGKKLSEVTKQRISKTLKSKERKLTEDELKMRSENNKGAKNPQAKLNEDQVRDIRHMAKEGYSYKEIHNKYSFLHEGYIALVVLYKRWKHVI